MLFLPMIGFGQGWEYTYQSNHSDGSALRIEQSITLDNGNIISIGKCGDPNNYKVCLIKFDSNGNKLDEIYYEPNWSIGTAVGSFGINSLIKLDDSNLFFQIYRLNKNDINVECIFYKIDTNGNIIWNSYNYFSGFGGYGDIQEINFGGGGFIAIEDGKKIAKFSNTGTLEWSTYHNIFNPNINLNVSQVSINSLSTTSDFGFFVCGRMQIYESNSYEFNSFYAKLDGNCNVIWEGSFGFNNFNDFAYDGLELLNGSGFIVTGTTESFAEDGNDSYILSINQNGEIISQNTFNSEHYDSSENIFELNNNSLLSTGWRGTQPWNFSGFVINKYNYELQLSNSLIINSNELSFGQIEDFSYTVFDNNDILISGYIFSGGLPVSFLKKISIENTPNSITDNNSFNKNQKIIKIINYIGQEIKPQTNQPIIEIYDDGTVEKKVIIE